MRRIKINKRFKIYVLWPIAILLAGCIALLLICNIIVVNNAKNKLYTDIESVPSAEYGLLLGTSPYSRFGKKPNTFFIHRIDAAEQLYKAGKIKKILISGDERSLDNINEVECMKDSLVARGVDAKDIILDGKGYRTINSIENAVKIYNIHSFIVISQKFHNERAIYIAEHSGFDTNNVIGFNAANSTSNTAFMTYIREYFARVKMFIDMLFY
ncbi:MAG: YdcF family protein [Muribaculaceae bacterium]|nr:YdcF family protein [Muribaculaceae bacterium]